MNNFTIIFLAGYSCAGKSTLGESFCMARKISHIHQQTVYRELAKEKGYLSAREWLAEVGQDRFIKDTIEATIRHIISVNPEKAVLIDEVYNLSEIRQISNCFPNSKVVLMEIVADQQLRGTRMVERLGENSKKPETELEFRDSFLREAGLDEAIKFTNIKINNSGTIEGSIIQMSEEIQKLGITL